MLDDLYRDLILDHYRNPRGAGAIPRPDRSAEGQNPLCGDECSVALSLGGDRVEAVQFRARGCSISVASGSMMAGEIEGRSLAEVRALEASVRAMLQGKGRDPAVEMGDVEALEGVSRFPVRVKCALLPWTTLLQALGERGAPGGPAPTEPTGEGVRAGGPRRGGGA